MQKEKTNHPSLIQGKQEKKTQGDLFFVLTFYTTAILIGMIAVLLEVDVPKLPNIEQSSPISNAIEEIKLFLFMWISGYHLLGFPIVWVLFFWKAFQMGYQSMSLYEIDHQLTDVFLRTPLSYWMSQFVYVGAVYFILYYTLRMNRKEGALLKFQVYSWLGLVLAIILFVITYFSQ